MCLPGEPSRLVNPSPFAEHQCFSTQTTLIPGFTIQLTATCGGVAADPHPDHVLSDHFTARRCKIPRFVRHRLVNLIAQSPMTMWAVFQVLDFTYPGGCQPFLQVHTGLTRFCCPAAADGRLATGLFGDVIKALKPLMDIWGAWATTTPSATCCCLSSAQSAVNIAGLLFKALGPSECCT